MLKWLLLAIGGYVSLLALMYVFQRSLMYFPETVRTAPAAAGLPDVQEIALATADGETIIAWHRPPPDDRPLIIYFHGNGGSLRLRDARFRKLVAAGNGLLAVSYRGYAGSTGRPSEEGLLEDARAAYAYAAERVPAARIVLFGESLGTGVAIALAAEKPVAKLILEAPFTSAADIGAAAYPFVPVRWLMKDQFRSSERIERVGVPILLLHGEQDRVIPIASGDKLYARMNEPKRFVRFPKGGHSNLDAHGALDAVSAFLSEPK